MPLSLLPQSAAKGEKLELTVMTFNILATIYSSNVEIHNRWEYRRDTVAKAILDEDIDIIGAQEVTHEQLDDLNVLLQYDYVACNTRENGRGIMNVIFYKRNRFKIIDSGNFWLSETPDIPDSKGWDAAALRVAGWVIMEEIQSQKQLFFINTHLDHRGRIAQEESVRLLLHRINMLHRNMPVIMTGDFNVRPISNAIEQIKNIPYTFKLVHTKDIAEITEGYSGTYHNFGTIPNDRRALIDYIFASEPLQVYKHSVLSDKIGTVFLSDHAPVVARLTF